MERRTHTHTRTQAEPFWYERKLVRTQYARTHAWNTKNRRRKDAEERKKVFIMKAAEPPSQLKAASATAAAKHQAMRHKYCDSIAIG